MIEFSGRGILLDIEGTTSSISFVHDCMFPFVRENLDEFLRQHFTRDDVVQACQTIARDAGHRSLNDWRATLPEPADPQALIAEEVVRLMDGDDKATGLKALQGLIWDGGFRSGRLRAHVYSDVPPAIERWRGAGLDVRIFSSGSIAAQKLFFGHVDVHGDCLRWFSGHYDTTIGSKKEPASYAKIAADWNLAPGDVLFISDLAAELDAALAAGMRIAASLRPGNTPLPAESTYPRLCGFDEVVVTG